MSSLHRLSKLKQDFSELAGASNRGSAKANLEAIHQKLAAEQAAKREARSAMEDSD